MPVARRLRVSMGTLVAIEAAAGTACAADAALEAAFAAILSVDQRMHPHAAGSDLERINTAPLRTAVAVHQSTFELLELALRLSRLSDGVFDPCLPHRPGRLADLEIRIAEGATGDTIQHRVTCHVPVALDFGGFAKGYAVDRAIDALHTHGCSAGLVNAGGDMRLFGPRTEPILLRRSDGGYEKIELLDAALAVSDADSPNRPTEHQGYYNRVACQGDRTRLGSLRRRYVAVSAKSAVIADALCKCVMLCADAPAERALREFGAARLC